MSIWKLAGGAGRLVLANHDVVVCDGPDGRALFYASDRSIVRIQAALDAGCMTWPADEWGEKWEALGWKLMDEGKW